MIYRIDPSSGLRMKHPRLFRRYTGAALVLLYWRAWASYYKALHPNYLENVKWK